MEHKKSLTTEELSKKFKNQFEMVNYAIKLAEGMIRTGRASRVETDSQNPAQQVLEEIVAGEDTLEDIVVNEMEETVIVVAEEQHPTPRGSKIFKNEKEEGGSERRNLWGTEDKPRRNNRKALLK